MKKEEKLNILSDNATLLFHRKDVVNEEINLTLSHIVSILCTNSDNYSIEKLIREYKTLLPNSIGNEDVLIYQSMSTSRPFANEMKKAYAIGSTADAPAGSHEKIATVKNNFNTLAFEHFSQSINNAKQIFASSFSQACELVNDGECEFCILPIENMSTGKMLSFYSIIDKYELKICSAYDICDDEGNTVRYALLGKGCFEPSKKIPILIFCLIFQSYPKTAHL